jgi:hypothetical protein
MRRAAVVGPVLHVQAQPGVAAAEFFSSIFPEKRLEKNGKWTTLKTGF